jgi:hypothetical protein
LAACVDSHPLLDMLKLEVGGSSLFMFKLLLPFQVSTSYLQQDDEYIATTLFNGYPTTCFIQLTLLLHAVFC